MTKPPSDHLNRIRRRGEQLADQAWARCERTRRGGGLQVPFDGEPRFALMTVNHSTTRYLKLMLRTLVEQSALDRLTSIVICDNCSRDGGIEFLRALAASAPRIDQVERRRWTHHAAGMRAALRALDEKDRAAPPDNRANILLFCDPDVVFLRDDTVADLARVFTAGDIAFAGELRHHVFPLPEAQASFLAVRRDWAARRDVSPWVHHGSPAWWMQRDIQRRGGTGADFPNNREGYALHRGRTAVEAARTYQTGSAHATAAYREPHFMGVPGGAEIWAAREREFAQWLKEESEPDLLRLLAERLG